VGDEDMHQVVLVPERLIMGSAILGPSLGVLHGIAPGATGEGEEDLVVRDVSG
jgi:hypothetical protein